jgi:hypothetical protein
MATVRCGFALCAGLAVPLAASPRGARVSLDANELQATPPCAAWVSDYALAARLRLDDTPFGAGDGVHDIGPGQSSRPLLRARSSDAGARELLVAPPQGRTRQQQATRERGAPFIPLSS